MESEIRIGCCGFAAARARYYETFHLVEIQQTFYDPPQVKTAEKWRSEAPAGFEFTLKAWQLITHPATSPTYRRLRKPLPEGDIGRVGNFQATEPVMRAWETTLQIARALKAGVVVFQCPASFMPTNEHIRNMRKFFGCIERADLLLAWEPRGQWEAATIQSLCQDLRLIHCVDPFIARTVTGGVNYFRLHGIGGYRYRFTDDDLRKLLQFCRGAGRHYVLFNNLSMFEDAQRFQALKAGGGG